MGDTRRDSGEYYPGGRVVARTGTAARQAVVRWSDVEGRPDLSGVEPVGARFTDEELREKINEVVAALTSGKETR